MPMKKKHLVRQKILESLQSKLSIYDGQEHLGNIELTLKELANVSNLTEEQVLQQVDYLSEIQEINISWSQGVQSFIILKNGTISFFDKKHLYKGRKEFWNDTYDVIKTLSAAILLIIAVTTFVMNIFDTRQNRKDIETIKAELQQKDTVNFKR